MILGGRANCVLNECNATKEASSFNVLFDWVNLCIILPVLGK